MVRPRLAIEMQNSWEDIPAADQEMLLVTWREFMAADSTNELGVKNYRSGQCDQTRFSEKHCMTQVTFAWRCLLIGYWLGTAGQSSSPEASHQSSLEAISRSFSDEY